MLFKLIYFEKTPKTNKQTNNKQQKPPPSTGSRTFLERTKEENFTAFNYQIPENLL